MSLLNDALKRAQGAQDRPLLTDTSGFQPTVEQRRSGRSPKQLAALGAIVVAVVTMWLIAPRARALDARRPARPSTTRTEAQELPMPIRPAAALVSIPPAVLPAPSTPKAAVEPLAGSAPVATQITLGMSPAEIPTSGEPHSEAARIAPEPLRLEATKPLLKTDAPPPTEKAVPAEKAAAFAVYVVKPRDTLGRLAKLHHTTVKTLRGMNDLKTERILVGQKLKVPITGSSAPVS